MNEDTKKLLEYIIDNSKGASRVVFTTKGVVEIREINSKIGRLLSYLKQEHFIEQYEIKDNSNEKEITVVLSDEKEELDNIYKLVINNFIKKRYRNNNVIKEIDLYSKLFMSFVKVENEESNLQKVKNLFEFVVDKIDESNNINYIKILGPDGVGKSSFLSILYIYLYNCYREGKIKKYPFYINLNYYDREVFEINELAELYIKVEEKIKKDLGLLINLSKKEDIEFLIIIDGNNKYERSKLNSSMILDKCLEDIKAQKKIICLGEKTNIHNFRNYSLYLDGATTYTFYFSPIFINEEKKWSEAIEIYCKIFHKEKEKGEIISCIRRFNIKEIDYNLLTIFSDVSAQRGLRNITSISNLYHQYCMHFLGNYKPKLDMSIGFAYKYFKTSEYIEQKQISENWKEWELIHQHKTISNYLLACYYSEKILNKQIQKIEQMECVFTNGINIFMKSILNETIPNQKNTINFCMTIFKEGDFKAKTQAAYLLGRIKDNGLQKKAKELLENYLRELKNNNELKSKEDKKEYYFLQRSFLVSLLYMGDVDAGEQLLDLLFKSPMMNGVNRAFYLQYYEDVISEDIYLYDRKVDSIANSVNVLINYVENQLQEVGKFWGQKKSYDFQIHLFTLCSLVQFRLNANIEKHLVDKLKLIISSTLESAMINLSVNMQIYLEMLKEDIERKTYDIGHLYNELYILKDIRRVEYNYSENIVEHTYYSWLIGMLYLPENYPRRNIYKKYDKKKILNCLLTHEFSKIYSSGDEKLNLNKIFMHDMYIGIENMNSYKSIYKNLDSDINGIIAKEIYIIQTLYQFCIYKREHVEFEKDKERELKGLKDKIKTKVGREILEKIVLDNFKDVMM